MSDIRFQLCYLTVLLLLPGFDCQITCNANCKIVRAYKSGGAALQPQECAGCPADVTNPIPTSAPAPGQIPVPPITARNERTNSIQDFCIVTDIFGAGSRAPTPTILGQAAPTCYPTTIASVPTAISHSAGLDPNWQILEHLSQHHAQSFQPFDDLPYVNPWLYVDDFFLRLNPSFQPDPLPAEKAPNPYFVEVTGISVKGELLQNFLHFRIFANLSVALAKDQVIRGKVLHGRKVQGDEKPNYATGRISAMLMMVKDQDGWPIGDFSMSVPCWRTCSKYSHDVYYGDERNALPCSYTPPYASTHPGMFVFDVDPGRYCTKPPTNASASPPPTTPAPAPGTPPAPQDPRLSPHTARREGVREVHATWSFGHNTCNFVQRIYIQTLIFEDVETVYDAHIDGVSATGPIQYDRKVLFGWTAQYNILRTTRGTLGAPDYVDLKYLRERDLRAPEIDCHVPLFDSEDAVKSSFIKFLTPGHQVIFDSVGVRTDVDDIRVPSRLGYLGALTYQFQSSPSVRYFGQHAPTYPGATGAPAGGKVCRDPPPQFILSDYDVKPENDAPLLSVSNYLVKNNIRCPCPALPSTLPPENRTADPARVFGRLIHASHMAIAYMLLTPIGCFVARYYKETFVTVFCFQEYWWYMWHVITLIAACLFNVGAITSIARKKELELNQSDNLKIHIILGAMSIFVFYMEIITGFFRVADPKKRMRQIFMHWLIGVTNNACAVGSMYAMAWVDQSGFSCKVAYTVTFWLVFVITCFVVMEVNMRKTDKKLRLIPRRTYLPPPVKRLFTKEPPGRAFRLLMLGIFIVGLLIIQYFVSYYIWDEEGASCEEEIRAKYSGAQIFNVGDDDGDDGAGDDDDSY